MNHERLRLPNLAVKPIALAMGYKALKKFSNIELFKIFCIIQFMKEVKYKSNNNYVTNLQI